MIVDPLQKVSNLTVALATAEGFFHLRLWRDAWGELSRLSERDQEESAVQLLRLRIQTALENWFAVAALAKALVNKGYWDSSVYVLGSHAILCISTLDEAEAFLRSGASHLQGDASFHYLTACYACRRGDSAAGKASLERALQIDPSLRALAFMDKDLETLWSELSDD